VWISTFWARHRSGLLTIAIILVVILAPTWLGLVSRLSPSTGSLIYSLLRSSEPAAIQTYERALQRHPNNIRLIRALADAYRRLGVGATRAAELWERLYELCPTDREVRDRVVQMTLESGRETDIALHACQIWFVEYPDHPDAQAVAAHLARFYCSRRLTAPESALPALRRAAEAAPADQDLHAYVAALNLHYGHGAQAIAMLNALVEGNPENEMLRQQLAQALISTGDAYQAYRHLRILSPSPEVTTDLYLAGVVAQSAGRYRESLRILQEVMRRDPALFDIQERVAEVSAHAMLHHYGQFEIVETIAGQEASVLYGARHPNYGDVLLVVFRRDFSDTLGFPTAFTEQLPLLQSPVDGCADLLDFGNEEEEYFVAYALPRGRPLSTVMQEKGLQEAHKAGEITLSILEALQSLHTRQRLHGDLRPSAIWLDEIQGVTLVGAGLSMLADTDSSPQPPTARSAFHTSPEVIERHELSAASDLYAVGCILYELLVGSPPLEGPTQLATLMAHVTINPEPPSMKAPNVPPEMDHLVLQALAKDPAVRPPSAKAFAEELRKVLQTLQPPLAEPTAEPEHNVPPLPGTPAATRILLEPPDPLRWWTYYADLSLIATGRFTKVYRGVYRQTGELHAIKHLQVPRALNEAEGLRGIRAAQAVWRLFQGEIHLLQSLTEKTTIPGLIRMLQIYREDENSPAYAMPLMHRTLGERIATEGPLTFQEAMRVIQELGTTVEALHEREIVHRSITPRSVMFDAEGQVHLGGFDGACRLVDRTPFLLAEREIQQTSPSPLSLFGDIRFLAPERCRGDEFDTSTDVYSLGALLFFMLAGKAPFEHPDELQIMLHHVSTPPPRLYEVDVAVPTYIQEVLDRALAKSPAERYQTAGALVNALTSHLVTRG
ncbi:MAG: protein kinase domain-containing protein, partial [Candidatus Zipacnadales bacterium]